MVIQLLFGYFSSANIEERKSGDYILVKDYRNDPKHQYPTVHILNKRLQEMFAVGKTFKLNKEGEDGFDDNLYNI